MRQKRSTRDFVMLALLLVAPTAAISQPPASRSGLALARAARGQVGITRLYDPSYRKLSYPGGDVPIERGVCSDVVIRAFRSMGIDLQAEVHKDMRQHFNLYPRMWGLRKTDTNIDHRRVPNLMLFFKRRGKALPLRGDFLPGDVVAWRLSNGLHHIGIVAEPKARAGQHLVVHNIGQGAQLEDVLNSFEKIGHYRW